jgi:gluconate 2-dehydrogenase gamma chain
MTSPQRMVSRRWFLATTAVGMAMAASSGAGARVFFGSGMPWDGGAAVPPQPVVPGPWAFFTPAEARVVEAIVERLIPADELSISGKDAGCAVFIDRQLAGDYGTSARLYMRPPFQPGLPNQGDQSDLTPARKYRAALPAIDEYCRRTHGGRDFAALGPDERDAILTEMEKGKLDLGPNIDSGMFFSQILQNTMEGFFADPIYGGNKDMVSWKMIGFPGVRYDYRDHVLKHNQKYPLPPVSIQGRQDWTQRS